MVFINICFIIMRLYIFFTPKDVWICNRQEIQNYLNVIFGEKEVMFHEKFIEKLNGDLKLFFTY